MVVLIVLGLISWLFTVYNGLVQVKENIKKSWANINVLLMQRSAEIPKLLSNSFEFKTVLSCEPATAIVIS